MRWLPKAEFLGLTFRGGSKSIVSRKEDQGFSISPRSFFLLVYNSIFCVFYAVFGYDIRTVVW